MKKYNFLCFRKFLLLSASLVWIHFCHAQSQANVRDSVIQVIQLDNVIVIGYATGSLSAISGSVDKIKEAEMNKGLLISPPDAIRGRIAGVNITPANNGPAVLSSVRIRGTTSLTGGNDPLIIVDGVFGNLNTLSSIYPADIESFTILKDASETAQYGSRGASGVIEIATKKGSDRPFNVSYYGSISADMAARNLKMLSGNEFRQLAKDRNLEFRDLGNNTDFIKEMTSTALVHNHHLAISSGTKTSNYRISAGFTDREGVIKNNRSKNFTTKIDIHQKAVENKLTVDVGLFGSMLKNNYLFDFQKTFYSAAAFNPTFPNHKNIQTGSWDNISYASQITNPLAWLEVDDDEDNALVNAHAKINMFITDNLKLSVFGSYTYNSVENSQYLPTTVWGHGQAYRGLKKSEHIMGNLVLNYKKDADVHHINLVGLAEFQRDKKTGFFTTVTNFSSDEFGYNNLQAGALRLWEGTGSYYEDPKLVSFMGRINYIYDRRYIATLNTRTDGSSKVGKNNKWGFFPSASAAWAIHEENFLKSSSTFNELKIRLGYGLAGNQDAIDSYTSMQLIKPNGTVPIDGSPTVTLGTIRNANPDLKWEVKHTVNTGIDMALLGNKIFFKADYYYSKTNDMLYRYQVSVPPFTYNTLLANLGSMENRGLEVSLGIVPLKNDDMELNVNANVTFQKNKLLSLDGVYKGEQMRAPGYISVAELNGAGMHGGYNQIVYHMVGQPLGVFYLPKSTGLVQGEDGKNRYGIADLNGGGVNLENGEDRYIAGQVTPKVLLGTNISFRYREFDLSLQINGAFGHKIYNGTSLTYMNMNSFPDYNILKKAPAANIHDLTATDYWLESGDYVNIDYLTVGWNVPLRFFKGDRKSIRVTFSVSNLATITGYSGLTPMINNQVLDQTLGLDDKRTYPVSRSYTLGLNVKF